MTNKFSKWRLLASIALCCALLFSTSAYAFDDLSADNSSTAKINALHDKGIVSGIDDSTFAPDASLTYAQAVALLVKGFDLNIDNLRFIREPKASDNFANVDDNAWYAHDFIVAYHKGLPIPADVDPNAPIARQDYADLLAHALATTGDYPTVKMFIIIADSDDIAKDKMGSIQDLLLMHIAKLDDQNRFRPTADTTRGVAAELLYNALEFLDQHTAIKPLPPTPAPDPDVTKSIDKVTDEVNKVTLSWGEKPNTCYQISITGIEFATDTATVLYETETPQQGVMCGQMIVHPQASTYVDSKYKVEIQPAHPSNRTLPATPAPAETPPMQPVTSMPAAG
jgi:hypothetical protein